MKNSRGFLIAVAVILAVALVLFAAHTGLASTAQSNEDAAFSQMLELMMPGGAPFEELEYTGSDSSITAVYGAANGNYVVQTATDGFNGLVTCLVGVNGRGQVISIAVTDLHATYNLGENAMHDADFLVQILGSSGELVVGDNIDGMTGATITSAGVVRGANAAASYILSLSEPEEEGGSSGGALTGTADGYMGPITVEVTMDGDTITGVTVTSNSETPNIAGAALEQIPAAIVEANSPDVDAVSGATYTSNGIMDAVRNALESAGSSGGALTGTADGYMGPITVEVTMEGDTITGVTVTSNSETPNIAGAALEQIPAAIVEANSPDVDAVSGATYTSNGIMDAVRNALEGAQ